METTKFLQKDFLDILFDTRNKDYGAYDHRVRYNKRVRNAVIGMSSIMMVVIGGYALGTLTAKDRDSLEPPKMAELPKMQELDMPEDQPPVIPPPPANTPPPAAAPTIKATIFKVTPDEDVRPEDEVPKNEDMQKNAIGVANIAGDPNGSDMGAPDGLVGGTNVVEAPRAAAKEEIRTFVEQMPEFPGGEEALRKYLNNNTRYPQIAQDNGIQGIVVVKFVVGKDGVISMVETQGAKKGAGLEEEALRVVRKMPKWKPGRQNGEYVPVYFNLPINFRMAEQ